MEIDDIKQRYGIDISTEELARWRDEINTVLHGVDRSLALQLAERLAQSSYPIALIYLEFLQPALYAMGNEWATGKISSMCIHIASALSNAMLAMLYHLRISGTPLINPEIFVSCVPGNLHELGPRMIADLLETAGFRTIYLGPPIEPVSLYDFVFSRTPWAVCLSAALPEHLATLWSTAETLRRGGYSGYLAAGGYALRNHNGHLWRSYGVDWAGTDVLALINWFNAQLAPQKGISA